MITQTGTPLLDDELERLAAASDAQGPHELSCCKQSLADAHDLHSVAAGPKQEPQLAAQSRHSVSAMLLQVVTGNWRAVQLLQLRHCVLPRLEHDEEINCPAGQSSHCWQMPSEFSKYPPTHRTKQRRSPPVRKVALSALHSLQTDPLRPEQAAQPSAQGLQLPVLASAKKPRGQVAMHALLASKKKPTAQKVQAEDVHSSQLSPQATQVPETLSSRSPLSHSGRQVPCTRAKLVAQPVQPCKDSSTQDEQARSQRPQLVSCTLVHSLI